MLARQGVQARAQQAHTAIKASTSPPPFSSDVLRGFALSGAQVCNHPMLSYPNYTDFEPTLLVRECGKMEVLDRLLVKLHATGHRVLLFSTMTKVRTPPPSPASFPPISPLR